VKTIDDDEGGVQNAFKFDDAIYRRTLRPIRVDIGRSMKKMLEKQFCVLNFLFRKSRVDFCFD
jgi:hypothetical protein